MFYSDDPVRDAERHYAEQDRQLEKRPVCSECGEPVQHDFFFLINDEVICPDCLVSNYRKEVEDYIE